MLSLESLVGELVLSGRLQPEEQRRWLTQLGVGERAAVLVFSLRDPGAAAGELHASLTRAGAIAIVTEHDGLLCAVVDCQEGSEPTDPVALAARARGELAAGFGDVGASASQPALTSRLHNSYHEARCALRAVRDGGASAPEVASYRDLGAFRLLLSIQDDEALAAYCDSVLGPVQRAEGEYGEELLRSLDVFIERNGHWERAAGELYCHRHTLRYRVRRVEQLTGRDFSHARDRIEFWLALRGRELAR